MKKFRIGNDITCYWNLFRNGKAENFAGKDIDLYLINPSMGRLKMPFAIDDNKIVFTFNGVDQEEAGAYSCVLIETYADGTYETVDAVTAFILAERLCNNTVDNTEPVSTEFASEILVGPQGESAYKAWLKCGHEGTEEDFLDWLREPAVSAGEIALDAAKKAYQAEKEVLATNELMKLAEAGRATAETARVEAENSRAADENARKEAEAGRVTAESARVKAEDSRVADENARKEAEAGRVSAETARVEAEDSRVANENARKEAEAGRVSAETARVEAENSRVADENARKQAEAGRVSAETARVEAESLRVADENARKQAEAGRVTAETARVEAEDSRVANENARKEAEAGRVSAETARVEAESLRVSDETARKEAEAGRVTAETARVEAEVAREELAASMEIMANEAKSIAESAMTTAASAEANSVTAKNTAAQAAAGATNALKEVQGKQDKLTAGTGIAIDENNEIKVTLDTTIYKIVDTLPSKPAPGNANKIHLVLSTEGEEGNLYSEYLYTNGQWEQLGTYIAKIDLTPYLTKIDAAAAYLTKTAAAATYQPKGSYLTAITKAQVEAVLTGNITTHTHSQYLTTHQAVSNKAATLAWNTAVTVATVGSTDITVKLPANPNTDTKNTAGSTDTASKIFLIGATSQAASPQTYSHDTAFVGTDGCLYSGGAKVLTAHQSLAAYLTKTDAAATYQPKGNYLTAITKAQVEAVLTGNITTHTHSQYLTSHQSLSNYYTKGESDLRYIEDIDITGNSITFTRGHMINTLPLPKASYTTFGGVKLGTLSLEISSDETLNLKSGVVTAGSYAKVTVDTFGRVVAGTTLATADIPSLPWSKITSGKPTTLAGYGITDGANTISISGTGNAFTDISISGHTLHVHKGKTFIRSAAYRVTSNFTLDESHHTLIIDASTIVSIILPSTTAVTIPDGREYLLCCRGRGASNFPIGLGSNTANINAPSENKFDQQALSLAGYGMYYIVYCNQRWWVYKIV